MKVYAFNNLYLGTANKKYVKNAIKELERIDPDVKVVDRFPDGLFSFQINCHREILLFNLKENPPIFLRHIHPIDRMFFVPKDLYTPDVVVEGVLTLSDRIKPGKKVAVQARRSPGDHTYTLFTLKQRIDPALRDTHNAIPAVQRPQQVISIYVTDSTEISYYNSATCSVEECPDELSHPWSEICLMGISTPEENLCEWSGGQVRFSKEDAQVSRAEFKLLEAFEIFSIEPPVNGSAIDLGSSPGGWARILNQKGYRVTAVDRAPLDSDVIALDGVRFIQKDAFHFRDDQEKYDILTNDINRDPIQSARAMVNVSSIVKKGAPFVMTVKLPDKSADKIIEKVKNCLNSHFQIIQIRQLYHNRDEVTIYGKRKLDNRS